VLDQIGQSDLCTVREYWAQYVTAFGDVPSPKANRRVGGTANHEAAMRDATVAYVSSAKIGNVRNVCLFGGDDDDDSMTS
jgi:hypothetical protein